MTETRTTRSGEVDRFVHAVGTLRRRRRELAMTRPETRDAERLMRDVAKQRVSRRGLMKGAAAAGLALPAAASLHLQEYRSRRGRSGRAARQLAHRRARRPRRAGGRPAAGDPQAGSDARPAGRGRYAAAGRGAGAAGAAGRAAGRRHRHVWRHPAPRLHRTGRRRERQPLRLGRQARLLGLHRHRVPARRWPRAGSSATATGSSPSSCARATSGPTARPSPPTTSSSGTRTST